MKTSFETFTDSKNFIYGIDIAWEDKGYFGHIYLDSDNGKIKIWTETMGKIFTKELLNQIIDESELME